MAIDLVNPKFDPVCDLFVVLTGFELVWGQATCLVSYPAQPTRQYIHTRNGESDNRYAYYATLSFTFLRRTERASAHTQQHPVCGCVLPYVKCSPPGLTVSKN